MRNSLWVLCAVVAALGASGCLVHRSACQGCQTGCDSCAQTDAAIPEAPIAMPDHDPSRCRHCNKAMPVGGPPSPTVTYPYYTTRGPRDFLLNNPPSIGN